MKKNILITLSIVMAVIAVTFVACNKDEQLPQGVVKKAAINPLKDIEVGKTFTFYGQTSQNLANEEVCQMQLIMGKNGEWTVKKEIIPNKKMKSSVDIVDFATIGVPDEYRSFPDAHTVKFKFPENGEVKYFFIPFDKQSNYKAAIDLPEIKRICYCSNGVFKIEGGGCKLYSDLKNGTTYYRCIDDMNKDNPCNKIGGLCILEESVTHLNPGDPYPWTPGPCGVVVPGTALNVNNQ